LEDSIRLVNRDSCHLTHLVKLRNFEDLFGARNQIWLESRDEELGLFSEFLDQICEGLPVGLVEGGVKLVEDVERSWVDFLDGKEQGNGNDSFLAAREVVEGAEVVLLDSCKGNLDGDARVNLVSTFEDLRHFLDLFSLGDLRLSGFHELYLSLASWLYPLENELELLF